MEQQLFTGTVAGTGSAINVNLGFTPSAVEIWNPMTDCTLNWISDMADGYGVKVVPLADDQLLTDADFSMSATNKAQVYTRAFKYLIDGTTYSKAATTTDITATTIPQLKYGLFGFQIGLNGTIDARDATGNAAGYDSAASAIADIPTLTGSHISLGYLTVMSTAAAGFVGATTEFDSVGTATSIATATFVSAQNVNRIITGGITPIETGDSTTIPGGFTIGTDSDLNVSGDTLSYKAWR